MGGGGGARKDLLLQPGEYITEVFGRSGDYVDSLTIRTGGSRSQTMTWGGSGGSRSFDYKAPPGTEIVFFWGRSGQYLDAIGVDKATPASNPPLPSPNAVTNPRWSGYVAETNLLSAAAEFGDVRQWLMDRSDGDRPIDRFDLLICLGGHRRLGQRYRRANRHRRTRWLTASPSITHGGRCSPPGRSSRSNAST